MIFRLFYYFLIIVNLLYKHLDYLNNFNSFIFFFFLNVKSIFLAISLIIITEYFLKIIESDFSSVGRAFDCRGYMEIKGSLVQIREVGFF